MKLPREIADRLPPGRGVNVAALLGGDPGPNPPPVPQTENARQTRRNAKRGRVGVVTEAQFQRAVVEFAELHGWRVIHHPDSRRATGAGWVDLVLGHEAQGRVVFAELKTERGRVRADQAWWHAVLTAAGCEVHVWRPSRWGEVVAVLGG